MADRTTSRRFGLDKMALFEDLGYQPHEGQLAVHRSKASRRVLACGVRWGKSTCAAMEAIAALLEPREESLGWIVGPSYDLAHLIYRQCLALLERHLAHRIEEVTPRDHRILVRNLGGGLSEVRARSADNPASLLGEGLDWLILDEAARLKGAIWEGHLSQRLIDKRGWALLLSTPRGKGWFYAVFRRGQRARDPDFESWSFPSWTNPHLNRELIEREKKRLGADAYCQEYGAEFIGEGIEQCELCGDPDPNVSGLVILTRDEPIASCPECAAPVNASGKALQGVMNGQPYLSVIRVCVDDEDMVRYYEKDGAAVAEEPVVSE
jgi:hypothetical protein